MKNRTMVLMLGVVLIFIFSVTGCSDIVIDDYATNQGYENGKTASSNDQNAKGKPEDEQIKGVASDKIKIGVLYISDPASEIGYSFTHDLGIQEMQYNLKLREDQILRKIVSDQDEEGSRKAMEELVEKGCHIIFATSWGYMQTVAELAEKYPNVYFSHGTGNLSNGKNFNNYFGRIYQARYLSGIVAGMNTKTNKIGYVAAQDNTNSEVTGGIDAFAIGVYSVNTDAKIYVKVTHSWFDAEKEAAASKELIALNCDVLAQHCDTPYPQIYAEKAGVYGIGYNSDMSRETPNTTLCSVIWNWRAYYTAAVQSVIEGTWDGSDYYGGMAEGLVQITELADFCVEGTKEKVDEAKAEILNGTFHVFDGVMETNTGETVGAEGGTLEDSVITSGMNWYYKNVEIIE